MEVGQLDMNRYVPQVCKAYSALRFHDAAHISALVARCRFTLDEAQNLSISGTSGCQEPGGFWRKACRFELRRPRRQISRSSRKRRCEAA